MVTLSESLAEANGTLRNPGNPTLSGRVGNPDNQDLWRANEMNKLGVEWGGRGVEWGGRGGILRGGILRGGILRGGILRGGILR